MSASAPGVTIVRQLTDEDLPAVLEIENASFSTPWHESTFRGLMARRDTDLVAAVRDERLIGYAAAWTVVDQAELGNVAVDPAVRGSGAGRALVEAVIERVRQRKGREIFLEVRESNTAAQSLYRRHGFAPVGRRKGYYSRPTEDAIVMRLQIPPVP